MAQIKISELPEMEELDASDVFASVDASEQETKKTSVSKVLDYVNKNADYTKLQNKPQINSVELTGNVSLDTLGIADKKTVAEYLPKNNAEGTDNTFEDGLERPLFALGGDGKSEQVVTTGKNLLPYPYPIESKVQNGVTFTVNKDGSVTINGTPTDFCSFQILGSSAASSQADIPGNYISGGDNEVTVAAYHNTGEEYVKLGSSDGTFTKIDKSTYTKGYIELRLNPGKTFNNKIVYPMLSDEQNIPWEQYSNGIPSPSPDYEQPINSIEGSLEFNCKGKNLFNFKPYVKLGELNGISSVCNDDYSITTKGTATSNYIQILNPMDITDILVDGETYTIMQKNPNEKLYLQVTKTRDDGSSTYESLNSNTQNCKSFTVNKKVISKYNIGIQTNNTTVTGTIDITNFYQIVRGEYSSWVDFETPKEPNEVTFNLNEEKLRSVGDVKDELVVDLETGDYYKVENVGEVVYTYSNGFYNNGQTTKTINFTCPTIENIPIDYGGGQDNIFLSNIIGSKYVADGTSFNGTTPSSRIRINIAREYLNVQEESNSGYLSALNELLQSLNEAGNPFTIHYPLATPTTKKLGTLSTEDLAKLKTFKGYNNVTVNTNLGLMNIRLTYGLDIKKYVDNKIAELSAQLIKGE